MPTGDNTVHPIPRDSSSGSSHHRNAPSSSSSGSSPPKHPPKPHRQSTNPPHRGAPAEPMEISIPSTSSDNYGGGGGQVYEDEIPAERPPLPSSYITFNMGQHRLNNTNHALAHSMNTQAQLQKYENDLTNMHYMNGWIDEDDDLMKHYDDRPSTSRTPEPDRIYENEYDRECKSAPPLIDCRPDPFDDEDYREAKDEDMGAANDEKMTRLMLRLKRNKIHSAKDRKSAFERILTWLQQHRKNRLHFAKEGLSHIQVEKKKISDDLDNVEKDKKLADQNWDRIGKETEAGTSQKDEEGNFETDDTPIEFRLMAEASEVKKERNKGSDPKTMRVKKMMKRPREILSKSHRFERSQIQVLRRRKERLIIQMRKRRRKELKERKLAQKAYDKARREFYASLVAWEQSDAKKAADERTREVIEKAFPEVKKKREDDERNERMEKPKSEKKQRVEDEATILARQQVAERQLRATAMPPKLLNEREKRRDVFIERPNSKVQDMEMDHRLSISAQKEKWSERERKLFKARLPEHCKNFGALKTYFLGKTAADCVAFYYLSKNEESYKSTFSKKKKRTNQKGYNKYQLPTLPGSEDMALFRSMAPLSLSNLNGTQSDRRCFACCQRIDGIDVPGCVIPKECYDLFELNEAATAVCFNCRDEAIQLRNAKCQGDTCSTKKKLKPSKTLPPVLRKVNQRQRAFLFDKLNAPRVSLKFCASCYKKLGKTAELLLNGDDEELKAEYDRYDGEVMWSEDEIDQLTRLINIHGVLEWNDISKGMDQKRTAVECRRQYEKLNGMKSDEVENVEEEVMVKGVEDGGENVGDGEEAVGEAIGGIGEAEKVPEQAQALTQSKRGRGKGRYRRGGGRGGRPPKVALLPMVEQMTEEMEEMEVEVAPKEPEKSKSPEKLEEDQEEQMKVAQQKEKTPVEDQEKTKEDEKVEEEEAENKEKQAGEKSEEVVNSPEVLKGSNVIGIKMPVEIVKRGEKRSRTTSDSQNAPELDTENQLLYRRVETERTTSHPISVIGIAQPALNVQSGALTPANLPKRSPSQSQPSRSSSIAPTDSQPPAKRAAVDADDQRMFASPSSSSFNTSGPLLPKVVTPVQPAPATVPVVLLAPPTSTVASSASGVQLMPVGSPMPSTIAHPQPVYPERQDFGGSITSGTPFQPRVSVPVSVPEPVPNVPVPTSRPAEVPEQRRFPISFSQQPPPHQHQQAQAQAQQVQAQHQNIQNIQSLGGGLQHDQNLLQQKITQLLQPTIPLLMQQTALFQNPALIQLMQQLAEQQQQKPGAAVPLPTILQQQQQAAQLTAAASTAQKNAHLLNLVSPANIQQMQFQQQQIPSTSTNPPPPISRSRASTMSAADRKNMQSYESAEIRKELDKKKVLLKSIDDKIMGINREIVGLSGQQQELQNQYTSMFRDNSTTDFENLSMKFGELDKKVAQLNGEKAVLEISREEYIQTIRTLEDHLKMRTAHQTSTPQSSRAHLAYQSSRNVPTPTSTSRHGASSTNPLPKCGIGINQPHQQQQQQGLGGLGSPASTSVRSSTPSGSGLGRKRKDQQQDERKRGDGGGVGVEMAETDHEPQAKRKSGLEMFSGLTIPGQRQMPLAGPAQRAAQRGMSPSTSGTSASAHSHSQVPRINNVGRSIVAGTSGQTAAQQNTDLATQLFRIHVQKAALVAQSKSAAPSQRSTPKPLEDLNSLFPNGVPPHLASPMAIQAHLLALQQNLLNQQQPQQPQPPPSAPIRTVPVSPANTNNSDDICVVFESGPRNLGVPAAAGNNGRESVPMVSPQVLRPTPQMPTPGTSAIAASSQIQSLPTNAHPGIVQPKPQKPTVGGRIDLYDQFNLIRPPIGIGSSPFVPCSTSFVPTSTATSSFLGHHQLLQNPVQAQVPVQAPVQAQKPEVVNNVVVPTSESVVYSDMSSDEDDVVAPPVTVPVVPKNGLSNGNGERMISMLDMPDDDDDTPEDNEPAENMNKLLPESMIFDFSADEPAEIEDMSSDEDE